MMMQRIRPLTSATGLALGLALLMAGCGGSDNMLGPNQGRVRFVLSSGSTVLATSQPAATAGAATTDGTGPLTDGETYEPRRLFQSASVDLTSVLARNSDGVLVNVDMSLPVTVDILSMDNGRHVTLPDGDLPSGTYDQLVLVLKKFQGTTLDSTQVTIVPPGGGWTTVVPVCAFTVDSSVTTTVSLGFDLRNAFLWRNNHYFFQPRFSCDQQQTADTVTAQ
jgi:Domain of unknown function (DUF4382)